MDDNLFFGSLGGFWGNLNREHCRKEDEFKRLLAEPCMKTPKVGDRVLIAAGLIGHGFDWVRTEVEVVAIAETSVKVRFAPWREGEAGKEEWIHPALITDVLEAE